MGRCLSKNKVEPGAQDSQPPISKKKAKARNRFIRFFWRKSNKVGVAPESESETTLSEHASLMSHDDRVNAELMRLKDGNSTANIDPSAAGNQQTRRLPPIGHRSVPSLSAKSGFEILKELRESGVIANPRPGLSGCSFDIVDRATPVLDMPRSLSRLEREDSSDNGLADYRKGARLKRRLTAAEERRKAFLLRRKEALAARKTDQLFRQRLLEKQEAQEMRSQAKQIAAEERRQNQLLEKTKKVNIEDVRKRFDKIDNDIRVNAQKVLQEKEEAAERVFMRKEGEQKIAIMARNQHQRAVLFRKKDQNEQEEVDMEAEIEHDNNFGREEIYDL